MYFDCIFFLYKLNEETFCLSSFLVIHRDEQPFSEGLPLATKSAASVLTLHPAEVRLFVFIVHILFRVIVHICVSVVHYYSRRGLSCLLTIQETKRLAQAQSILQNGDMKVKPEP